VFQNFYTVVDERHFELFIISKMGILENYGGAGRITPQTATHPQPSTACNYHHPHQLEQPLECTFKTFEILQHSLLQRFKLILFL